MDFIKLEQKRNYPPANDPSPIPPRDMKFRKKSKNRNCPGLTKEVIEDAKKKYFANGGAITKIVPEESDRKFTIDTSSIHSGSHEFLTE